MKHLIFYLVIVVLLFCNAVSGLAQDVSIVGKVIAGYQGWFTAYGDGSPVQRWKHWSGGTYMSNNGFPAPGYLSFEAFPDTREYNSASLFQTGFANMGNGQPSKLFSSYKTDVIDKHFQWMQEYGIDGIALQRFLGETQDGTFKQHRDDVSLKVKASAQSHGRIYYIMYDMSAEDVPFFQADVIHLENLGVMNSPNYAKQNGKPVICLWGIGFNHRTNVPVESQTIINWLKGKGYYVIGGVPTNWRTGTGDSHPGYINVYNSFDMISPWSVGRFNNNAGADAFKTNYIQPDLNYCNQRGIAYQPVVFPGFAWSNWQPNTLRNEIPRNRGEFMWRQVYNVKSSNISNMYIAMFDEYDEATNIMKMADSYFGVPTNQYFLTSSADGTYVSSDFYLRLSGKATRVIKGLDPLTTNVTIPLSAAPVWFRSSFELNIDAMLTWSNTIETSSNVSGYTPTINPECGHRSELGHLGASAIMVSGKANGGASTNCYFKAIQVNIPVNSGTVLQYWIYPQMANARFVGVDLHCTDGTLLRNVGAIDQNGFNLHPLSGHGGNIPLNTWSKISSTIGAKLAGKTVDRILIGFDKPGSTGPFRGYIDDIQITNSGIPLAKISIEEEINLSEIKSDIEREDEKVFTVYPNPVYSYLSIAYQLSESTPVEIALYDLAGEKIRTFRMLNDGVQSSGQYHIEVDVNDCKAGMYIFRMYAGGRTYIKKVYVIK